jgi:hypothetical protein
MATRRTLVGFTIGLGIGAGLTVAMPLAASDPPPQRPRTGERWAPPPERPGPRPHGDEAHHDAGSEHGEVAAPAIGFRGCAFFTETGFHGRRGEARAGDSLEWIGDSWNNHVASVACHPGCRLFGFIDVNFGGARRVFAGATTDVGPEWNRRISAIRVTCEPTGPAAH